MTVSDGRLLRLRVDHRFRLSAAFHTTTSNIKDMHDPGRRPWEVLPRPSRVDRMIDCDV